MNRIALVAATLAATLLGCSETVVEQVDTTTWLSFEKSVEGPTDFVLYVYADGRFSSSVATLPWVDIPGIQAQGLSAGPRLVGTLTDDEMETLRTLLAEGQQRGYEQDACLLRSSCGGGTTYRLVVRSWVDGVPAMAANFAEDDVTPATQAMIEGIDTILKRTFEDGVPFNESDVERANEREWPTP